MKLNYLSLWALAGSASAYLATTTRYYDGQEGACGCGSSSGPDSWQLGISTNVYTAAGSQALFDTDGSSWCGAGCGKCYNLTSTGESPCSTCGTGGVAGDSIIIMVTNLCPYNGNEQWCPSVGSTNNYGYSYHFDIMAEEEIFGDNVVVNFEPVTCPGQAATDWDTCICHGQTDTDETPAGFTSAASSGTSATTAASSESSSTSSTVVASSSTSTSTAVSDPTTSSTSVSEPSTTQVAVESTSSAETSASSSSPVETSIPFSACAATTTTSTTSLIISTVVSETSTIWATSSLATTTSTSSAASATQSLYGQCGGENWTGATVCATGSTCKVQNPWYYQCVSSSD